MKKFLKIYLGSLFKKLNEYLDWACKGAGFALGFYYMLEFIK